jgi:hypothetical protein
MASPMQQRSIQLTVASEEPANGGKAATTRLKSQPDSRKVNSGLELSI